MAYNVLYATSAGFYYYSFFFTIYCKLISNLTGEFRFYKNDLVKVNLSVLMVTEVLGACGS